MSVKVNASAGVSEFARNNDCEARNPSRIRITDNSRVGGNYEGKSSTERLKSARTGGVRINARIYKAANIAVRWSGN